MKFSSGFKRFAPQFYKIDRLNQQAVLEFKKNNAGDVLFIKNIARIILT